MKFAIVKITRFTDSPNLSVIELENGWEVILNPEDFDRVTTDRDSVVQEWMNSQEASEPEIQSGSVTLAPEFAFVRHSDEGLLVQEIDRDGDLKQLHSDDQSWDSLGGPWEIVVFNDLSDEEQASAVFKKWANQVEESEMFATKITIE